MIFLCNGGGAGEKRRGRHSRLGTLLPHVPVVSILMELVQMVGILFSAICSAVSPDTLTPGCLVQHQENQAMQEKRVEEGNGAGRLV